ncbi:autotransporter beta-domain protein, partial [Chlamydia psittaci 06-1683]
ERDFINLWRPTPRDNDRDKS